jgi:hypothetical protein
MCDIVHRGHLHEPEVKLLYTSSSTRCLAIAAGAGYVWRQFGNSYSIVSLDASGAECTASYFEYDSYSGTFKDKATETLSLRLRGEIPGGAAEICAAIVRLGGTAEKFAPYLAALISERITEVPIPIYDRVVIAAANVVPSPPSAAYDKVLKHFLNVRNFLLAFASTTPLEERINACKCAVRDFSDQIEAFTNMDSGFAGDMVRRLEIASELCSLPLEPRESTFVAAMRQFAAEGDWEGLEEIARRYITNESPDVKQSAEQHLCLALANSDVLTKRDESLRIADELVGRAEATVDNFHICFLVNRNRGHNDRAKTIIRDAIARFNVLPPAFAAAATRFSVETGSADIKGLLSSGHGVNNE